MSITEDRSIRSADALYPVFARRTLRLFDDLVNQFIKIEIILVKPQLPPINLRNVKEVVDECGQPVDLRIHLAQERRGLFISRPSKSTLQDLSKRFDTGNRRP